jgi:hypothetical protein
MRYIVLTLSLLCACRPQPKEQELSKTVRSDNQDTVKVERSAKDEPDDLMLPSDLAMEFRAKNSRQFEDTLLLVIQSDSFEITPTGIFKKNRIPLTQLNTEVIVASAYLHQDSDFYYIFFTETDHLGATSRIQKVSKDGYKTEYLEEIPGFNLGDPAIQGNSAFITAIGFIGRIDLETGTYRWRWDDLYDNEKYSFNSFDSILVIVRETNVEFLSENPRTKHLDKVIVNRNTGEMVELIK